MPQLNLFIFFDGVIFSFFFIFCLLFFLKSILPFLSFFNKSNDYLTLYLLKELNSECNSYSDIYTLYLSFFKDYVFSVNSICMRYSVIINDNFIFFGFYGITEDQTF